MGVDELFAVLPGEIDARCSVGGKGRALASLTRAGLPVPAWFAVPPDAFEASVAGETAARLAAASSGAEAQKLLAGVAPADRVSAQIHEALAALGSAAAYAVRSSALEEDGASRSFAGQLESFLRIDAARVVDRVAAVWRSGFSDRLVSYRREAGLAPLAGVPAVIVQRMVEGEVSGVAFSADPVSGRRGIAVVAAVRGLGEPLVSGALTGDTWRVDRAGRVVGREPGDAGGSGLDDARVLEAAALVRRAEALFGSPQDIEWTVADGRLWLLQSRPITTLAGLPDPDAPRMLWDNANIIESYGGITSPLTFSFARRAYENVYREFCRLMRVPEPVIAANAATFAGMLGLVDGRVYYSLLNWYRVVALLPGYAANRRFLDQMLGVRGETPGPAPAGAPTAATGGRLRLAATAVTVGVRVLTLPRRIERFSARMRAALGDGRPDMSSWRPDELVAHYRALERQLIARWDAPVVNDFATMIFHGLLRRLAAAWAGDTTGALANELLLAGRELVSEEPARRVREMAGLAAGDDALVRALCEGEAAAALDAARRLPALERALADYLARFGDRCPGELKLESLTLHDDPLPLLRAVGQLARSHGAGGAPAAARTERQRETALARAQRALAGHPLRRLAFGWVLRRTRAGVRARENLRFERTRVFGRARQVFVELGRRLAALDRLDEARDVFYLEQDELLGSVEGWATTADLKGLVATRKAEYARLPLAGAAARPLRDDRLPARGRAARRGGRPRGGPRARRCAGRGAAPAPCGAPCAWSRTPRGRRCAAARSSSPSGPTPGGC